MNSAIRHSLSSDKFGSYFGSTLTSCDVDGDGVDELLVGAPLWSDRNSDEGRVFVYGGNSSVSALISSCITIS